VLVAMTRYMGTGEMMVWRLAAVMTRSSVEREMMCCMETTIISSSMSPGQGQGQTLVVFWREGLPRWGEGDDRVGGGGSNDRLIGGAGDDVLWGDAYTNGYVRENPDGTVTPISLTGVLHPGDDVLKAMKAMIR